MNEVDNNSAGAGQALREGEDPLAGVDIYRPTEFDAISLEELELYHLIMAYRAEQGLAPIPLSSALSATAGRHAADTYYNMMVAGQSYERDATGMFSWPSGGNLHSWSDAPYFRDHRAPEIMWFAPERLGLDYPSPGFEISAAGYADVAGALAGWQGSPGHDRVIVNDAPWESFSWEAVGVGVLTNPENLPGLTADGNIYHVWFGASPDPAGPPEIIGSDASDIIIGTMFDDRIRAGAGDDVLIVGGGNDVLDGGSGRNVAVFSGAFADYRIMEDPAGDAFLVSDLRSGAENEGRNKLLNIQVLRFSDGDVVILPAAERDLVTAPDVVEALQDGPVVTGNVLDNDLGSGVVVVAVNGGAATVGATVGAPVGATLDGALGTLTLQADGSFSYVADAAARLPDAVSETDVFTYTARDQAGREADATLTVTVTGVNDPASIAGDTLGTVVEEDAERQQASGLLTVTDPDAGEDRFAAPDPAALAGDFGSFTFNPETGAWTYTLANNDGSVRALHAGAEVTDSLTVTSLDGTASETITVTIHGTGERDAPELLARIDGIVRNRAGDALEGVSVTFTPDHSPAQTVVSTSAGNFGFGVDHGFSGYLHAARDYNPDTDGSFSARDALEVLRLAVGLAPSWGPASPMDYVAADINQDGQVTAADALDVLRAAVGLQSAHPPRWIFLDSEADPGGIDRTSSGIEQGMVIDPVMAGGAEVSMTGVLLGSMQDHA
ncbi:MAG: VCBS domain-containing protein [Pararhodobacter sp.]|nr:VCBS domain-containing protein [Pararhodobacter sp.]